MHTTGLILWYGVYSGNDIPYHQYVLWAVETLAWTYHVDRIIFCGGCTDALRPHLSEAQSMLDMLGVRETVPADVEILLEDRSITTYENLIFAREFLQESCNIVIACDRIRVPKVFLLAGEILAWVDRRTALGSLYENAMKQPPKGENIMEYILATDDRTLCVFGRDFARPVDEVERQIAASLLECASIDHPDLHERAATDRRKKWNLAPLDNDTWLSIDPK